MDNSVKRPAIHKPEGLSDWEAIGGDMRLAIDEVSFELGGQALQTEIQSLYKPETEFPEAEALRYLKLVDVDAPTVVMDRFEEIGRARRDQELLEQKDLIRNRAFVKGFGSILNLFGK